MVSQRFITALLLLSFDDLCVGFEVGNSVISRPCLPRFVIIEITGERAVGQPADLELIEDVLSMVLSEISGRPVRFTEEVIVDSAGFRVRLGTEIPRVSPLTIH